MLMSITIHTEKHLLSTVDPKSSITLFYQSLLMLPLKVLCLVILITIRTFQLKGFECYAPIKSTIADTTELFFRYTL